MGILGGLFLGKGREGVMIDVEVMKPKTPLRRGSFFDPTNSCRSQSCQRDTLILGYPEKRGVVIQDFDTRMHRSGGRALLLFLQGKGIHHPGN